MAYVPSSKLSDFIAIVGRIESAYPEWKTTTLIDNLRATSSYDQLPFQLLLNTAPGKYISAKSPLSASDRSDIYDFMTHATINNDQTETFGICIDSSTGRKVTIGHVIVGISAGIHHPKKLVEITIGRSDLGIDEIGTGRYREEDYLLGLDPLYATTIAGDLASTVAKRKLDSEISASYVNSLGVLDLKPQRQNQSINRRY